jgi:hypothetical protein
MKIDINNLLPEELSDETIYHLVTFFMNFAAALESCYFAQMRRHLNSISKSNLIDDATEAFDDEFPF